MSARKSLRMQVWHCGYVCSVRINMATCDLRNTEAFKARVCTALFDHGLDTHELNKLRHDDMYYQMGSRNVKIFNPSDVPNDAAICFNNVVTDTDPAVFKVRVGDLILPVETPAHPMRTVVDIEHMIRQRLVRYGATLYSTSSFVVIHGRWTMCTPTRRNYKHDVVSITPAEIDEDKFLTAVGTVQGWLSERRRHRRAIVIQHAVLNWIKRRAAEGWVTVES